MQRYTVCFNFHSSIKGYFYEIEFIENNNIGLLYIISHIYIGGSTIPHLLSIPCIVYWLTTNKIYGTAISYISTTS